MLADGLGVKVKQKVHLTILSYRSFVQSFFRFKGAAFLISLILFTNFP